MSGEAEAGVIGIGPGLGIGDVCGTRAPGGVVPSAGTGTTEGTGVTCGGAVAGRLVRAPDGVWRSTGTGGSGGRSGAWICGWDACGAGSATRTRKKTTLPTVTPAQNFEAVRIRKLRHV